MVRATVYAPHKLGLPVRHAEVTVLDTMGHGDDSVACLHGNGTAVHDQLNLRCVITPAGLLIATLQC